MSQRKHIQLGGRQENRFSVMRRRICTVTVVTLLLLSAAACDHSFRGGTLSISNAITGMNPADGSATGDATPTLSWDAVDGAVSYEIQIADSEAGVANADAVGTTTNSYTPDTPLTNGQTHYWRVRAIFTDGQHTEWGATYSLSVSWGAITGMSPTDGFSVDDTTPTLVWDSVDEATSYEVQIDDSEGGVAGATVETTSSNSYTFATALSGHYWYWRVRAVAVDGNTGEWSDIVTFVIHWETLEITGLRPTEGSVTDDTTPALSWDKAEGATGYELQIADSADDVAEASVETISSNDYTPDAPLPNEQEQHWRVRAINGSGETTEWSDVASFTVSWGADGPADGIRFTSELADLPYLDGNYTMTGDIDLGSYGEWTPIGSSATPFTGSFDGQGHTISGLTINTSDAYQGLFGYVDAYGAVENVVLEAVHVNGGSDTGALVGRNLGTVANCFASGQVTGDDDVGGLIGYIWTDATVTDCTANVSVTGDTDIGGLAGRNAGTVTGCAANGDVVATGAAAGGLVGATYSSEPIVADSCATGTVSGGDYYIGGLVGLNNPNTTVTGSYATGAVNGTGLYVGGLVGRNRDGAVVQNCYARGATNGEDRVGGLVGGNGESAGGTVTDSYATGAVSGSNSGGLVGVNAAGTVTGGFWNVATTGQPTSDGGTAATTTQMQTKSTYTDAGWDFIGEAINGTDDVWAIDSTMNDGYPYLSELPPQ